MSEFNAGDKVIINGSLVAEIVSYDEESDRLAYVHGVGGGTNTVYGHVSQTRVEAYPVAVDNEVVAVEESKAKGDK